MLNLIDTHIHLDAPELEGHGPQLLPAARQVGIGAFIIPGVRVSGWPGIVALAEHHDGVFAAPGLHPAYADQWSSNAAAQLVKLTADQRVVAIGEIGLDGAVGPDLDLQEQVFREQLDIAVAAKLPVLLHARKATGRMFDILMELQIGKQVRGIWHGFSGSLELAEQLVAAGFLLGVGPILLRDNARKLPAVVKAVPLSTLVLETDLPDMATQADSLRAVATRIAQLRGDELALIAATTTANVENLFGSLNYE